MIPSLTESLKKMPKCKDEISKIIYPDILEDIKLERRFNIDHPLKCSIYNEVTIRIFGDDSSNETLSEVDGVVKKLFHGAEVIINIRV